MKRHHVKVKNFMQLLGRLPKPLAEKVLEELPKRFEVEVCKLEGGFEVYLAEGKPLLLVDGDGRVMPTLTSEALNMLPKVTVDRGAIPHICRGADVMRPGIVKVEGEFGEGEVVAILDDEHRKPLALGLSLFPSSEVERLKKGKMVKTIHYVGDRIWKLYRNFKA